jgi:bZIP transcription factor
VTFDLSFARISIKTMSSAAKRKADSSDDESSDDEDKDMTPPRAVAGVAGATDANADADKSERIELLKRKKRLALNRESARARRKRKKIRLETLEQRAEELSQRHHNLELTNQGLKTRIARLEAELAATTGGRAELGIGRAALGGGTAEVLSAPGGNNSAVSTGIFGSPSVNRAALPLGRQLMTTGDGAATANFAFSQSSRGMGNGMSDHEMQYLQLQQLMMAHRASGPRSSIRGGSDPFAAARFMALQDRRVPMAGTNLSSLRAMGASGMGGGHVNVVSDLQVI